MTQQQIDEIKKEFYTKLVTNPKEVEDYCGSASDVWQWFESKLEKVEQEIKQDLENHAIEVELDTEQCSEIALMVYEKYLEWLKKPQFMIIPFNEWVERNLKSNKLEK